MMITITTGPRTTAMGIRQPTRLQRSILRLLMAV